MFKRNFMLSKFSNLLNKNFNKFSLSSFSTQDEIEQKLLQKLKIESLEIKDLSGNCGTSFMIKIKSPDFNGKTMIAQHRIINEILKDEIKDIHALQLKTEASNK